MEKDIKISLDAKGRAFDNIFIERLWRSVKYEEVYLKDYASVKEAKAGLGRYFNFYNLERHHQHLNYKKPAEIYFNKVIPLNDTPRLSNSLFIPDNLTGVINLKEKVLLH